jgi:glutaminyl-peptide cyclotransferase
MAASAARAWRHHVMAGRNGSQQKLRNPVPGWHDRREGEHRMVSNRQPAVLCTAWCAAALAGLLIALPAQAQQAQVCGDPRLMRFEPISKIVRSRVGFTQGLEFREGRLYESTGSVGGTTQLNVIALDGKVTTLADRGPRVFGEGLTIVNDEIVQLTWQDRAVFVYSLDGKLKRQMRNPHDGWGLSNDGTSLLFTDGGPLLYYADPTTFRISKSVRIRSSATDLDAVNELELVGGKLYGNVFTTRSIVRLDPQTGCIDAVADLSVLWELMTPNERASTNASDNVLNGIAYDANTGLFYVTGKRWRVIFTGRFG